MSNKPTIQTLTFKHDTSLTLSWQGINPPSLKTKMNTKNENKQQSNRYFYQNENIKYKVWHIQHTHPFNGPLSRTTQVSRYQKGKTNLDFTEARDSEWQWHQLGHMQVCNSLQTDNHASIPSLSVLQA